MNMMLSGWNHEDSDTRLCDVCCCMFEEFGNIRKERKLRLAGESEQVDVQSGQKGFKSFVES